MSCLFLTVLWWTCPRKHLNMVAELDCPKRAVVTVRPGRDQLLLWWWKCMHARTHTANMQTCHPLLASRFSEADRRHRLVPTPGERRIQEWEKSYQWIVQAHTAHNVSLSPRLQELQSSKKDLGRLRAEGGGHAMMDFVRLGAEFMNRTVNMYKGMSLWQCSKNGKKSSLSDNGMNIFWVSLKRAQMGAEVNIHHSVDGSQEWFA